jgi:superfamily I DNA/RNA helicase
VDGLSAAQRDATERFVRLVEEARTELQTTQAAGPDALRLERWAGALMERVRLEQAIRAENRSDRAAEIRVENVRDFVTALGRYEQRGWAERPLPDEESDWEPPSLAGFLERISLAENADDGPSRRNTQDEEEERVTLMTLHSAKGLEFTHVFLVGLEEEILPHLRSVHAVGDDAGAPDPIAEERRLFYVGLTRARHRLTLSGCATRQRGGESVPRQPSRFLREIPPELLELRSPGARTSLSEEDSREMKSEFFSRMRDMLAS